MIAKSFERSHFMKTVRADKQQIYYEKKQLENSLIGCEIFAANDFNIAYAFNNRDGAVYKITATANGFNVELLDTGDFNTVNIDACNGIDYGYDADADNVNSFEPPDNVSCEPPDNVNSGKEPEYIF